MIATAFEEPWGKDSDLKFEKEKVVQKKSVAAKVAQKIILFHQNVISKADGPRSHFRPTSSQYMKLAIDRYGFFKGYIMGCDRLLRENDEKWIYPTIVQEDQEFKFDPAFMDKRIR